MDNEYLKKSLALGFTLIELLTSMIIIGILVSIAYPSYRKYMNHARRSDALQSLTQIQLTLERCYAQNFSYSAACGALPTFPTNSSQRYYLIQISNLTPTTYTLTATPQGIQAQDTECASFSVNQANVKLAADGAAVSQPTCWTK